MLDAKDMTVAVTRSAEDSAAWAARLAACGARALELPCIASELSDEAELGARLATATANADWLVLTSRRGVDAFAALHGAALPEALRVAAVGRATGEAARTALGRVDLIGHGTAAALGDELGAALDPSRPARVVLALAANAGDVLEHGLTSRGAVCFRFDVYRTLPAPAETPKRKLSGLGADAVIFASPSAVTGFLNRIELDAPVRYYSIGPSTSRAIRAAGLAVAGEAHEPNLEGILEIMRCQT
jgi:uroporphyrinogen-III synthase